MSMTAEGEGGFEAHRRHLFAIAYRMLGSVAEAEDVLQDAWLRWHGADGAAVENPRAFLSTIVTRLSLDRLRAARRNRESYVGPWLPEPLLDDPALIVQPPEETARDVSVALLLALERLSPLERAAFILHDIFEMEFAEVAATLGRNEAACRQLARRARIGIQAERPRFAVKAEDADAVARAFFAASRSGDMAALQSLLAESASLHTDGGGRRTAALNVVAGGDKVARFFAGLARKRTEPIWSTPCRINGLSGILSLEADGALQTVALELDAGRVQAVYIMRNPEKLAHLRALVPPHLLPS